MAKGIVCARTADRFGPSMLIGTDETDRHRMVCILLTDSGLGYTSLLFTVQSDWAAVIFVHQGFNNTVSQFHLPSRAGVQCERSNRVRTVVERYFALLESAP